MSSPRLERVLAHLTPTTPTLSPVAGHAGATLSSHCLNTTTGVPAAGLSILVEREQEGQWHPLAQGLTNADGRVTMAAWSWRDPSPAPASLPPGQYRATFDTGAYFTKTGVTTHFYPVVVVHFHMGTGHHHIPLLLSPFGYSTYKGS